jgi:hypothetical protein
LVFQIFGLRPKSRAPEPCGVCSWDYIDANVLTNYPRLEADAALKFGHLRRCRDCGGVWFAPEGNGFAFRLLEEWLPDLQRWDAQPFRASPEFIDTLAQVGGVATNGRSILRFPCVVTTAAGERHERAVVLISKLAPVRALVQGLPWLSVDEHCTAQRSALALPVIVRRASFEQPDASPVGVIDRCGKEYTLTQGSEFFDKDGVKGPEIKLSGRPAKRGTLVWPAPPDSVFLLDWFDGCEKLVGR